MVTWSGTLRWRITFLFAIFLAALLSGLGYVIYEGVEGFLLDASASRLRAAIDAEVKITNASANLDTSQSAGPALHFSRDPLGETSVLFLDAAGQPYRAVSASNGVRAVKYSDIPYDAIISEPEEAVFTVRDQQTRERTMVLLVALQTPDGSVQGLVQGARSLRRADQLLVQVRWLLVIAMGTSLLAAISVVLIIGAVSLRPLEKMATTAQSIATGDLKQRMAFAQRGDEIGKLATAFNTMLDSIQGAFSNEQQLRGNLKAFLADVSHELRTPLTAVRGYTDVLLRGGLKNQALTERALRSMQGELERMTRLISDLLSLSRIETGIGLRSELVDLRAVCREACAEVRVIAGGREVALNTNGPVAAPVDRDRLKQVVLNLLQNAIQHTPEQGHISVSVYAGDGSGVIQVADDGDGMAADDLPNVFERFYRGAGSADKPGGVGLGLAITKALVDAHHGKIAVESAPNQGTTFTVTLPLATT
ncbi:MAG: HAMP domain-containing histidine kinase [Dehalococcoidia bacterium]|nr:HAMP domain-containing histidine kinase [Dehalococcoidia bacterium]